MAGVGKQGALHVDVEFADLNRWHITSWHLENSAAGQLSQAYVFPLSTLVSWDDGHILEVFAFFSVVLFCCGLFCFKDETKPLRMF